MQGSGVEERGRLSGSPDGSTLSHTAYPWKWCSDWPLSSWHWRCPKLWQSLVPGPSRIPWDNSRYPEMS